MQQDDLDKKNIKLDELRASYSSMETLLDQLFLAEQEVAVIDSALSQRKFIIPPNLSQENFYDFVASNFTDSPVHKFVTVDYKGEIKEEKVKYYNYKVEGVGSFQSVYKVI